MERDLSTALAMLPEAYRAALQLRVAGASPAEVGAALGLDSAAVDPLLTVAEAKLRELLLGDC